MVRGVLKVFTSLIAFLLCLAVLRTLLGVKPLTFSGLLDSLSDIDIDFSSTLGLIAKIGNDFSFTNSSLWDAIQHFFTGIYDILCLPLGILMDLLSFVFSVVQFLVRLIGFDAFGLSGGGPSGGGSTSPGFGDGFGGGGFGGGGGRGT